MQDLLQQDLGLKVGFAALVLVFLSLDLGVFNRKAHVVHIKEALGWTTLWVTLALGFCGALYFYRGADDAWTFLTAYIVEQSLSVDNLFVFILIFSAYRIPSQLQHRVLFWGIIGALVMRALFIGLGVAALKQFSWLMYVFGAILIIGGIKTALKKDDDEGADPTQGWLARRLRAIMPITDSLHGDKFFVRQDGRLAATPLFLALVTVEASDLIFAVDSVPAVLSISQDPLVVYTSNVFAILGLRSLFFALAHLMAAFHYLKYALSVILVMIGVKLMVHDYYAVPTEWALAAIVILLGTAVLASIFIKPAPKAEAN